MKRIIIISEYQRITILKKNLTFVYEYCYEENNLFYININSMGKKLNISLKII